MPHPLPAYYATELGLTVLSFPQKGMWDRPCLLQLLIRLHVSNYRNFIIMKDESLFDS